MRRGRTDRGVVDLQAAQGLVPGVAGEEGVLELVQLAGDVVVLVEDLAWEDGVEDLVGQDVLDQDLAHVVRGQARIDGLARVVEEILRGLAEGGIVLVRAVDHGAQRFEHLGQVQRELLDRLAELRDLRALVAEEQAQQLLQRIDVIHLAADDLVAVLDQHRLGAVLEDDVVLRVATLELVRDLGVEVVLFVLGFPVAERQAQFVHQRAVDVTALPGR